MFLGTGVSGVAIIQVSNATANSGLETLEGDVTGALNTFAAGFGIASIIIIQIG